MGTLAISQLLSAIHVNRQREAKSREPTQFMSPSHEREHSLLGEHCSVVRLSEGSMLYVLRGWINAQWQGTRVHLVERLQPSGFAWIDRLVSAR
jgi:hypothetical protein